MDYTFIKSKVSFEEIQNKCELSVFIVNKSHSYIQKKSVNQYISAVKLAEAAKLIKETDFTSAEIAYKVGFSSPSYFNKTFRKRYGITPGRYKAQESTQKEKDKAIIELQKIYNEQKSNEIDNIYEQFALKGVYNGLLRSILLAKIIIPLSI
jgi:AraC-like DNA-binding protein